MIKANELRIGNFIYRQTLPVIPANFINKEIISVGKVDEDLFNDKIDCQFSPIPLTEEWLKKFGFEWKSENKTWRIEYRIPFVDDGKRIAIHVWEDEVMGIWGVTLWEVVPIDDVTPTVIKYVHQLQNLYHALTGQELQLTNSN